MADTEIRALFDAWNAALGTRDPATVVKLYADDAVLLPTLSNRVRRDHAAIEDYFVQFLARGPEGFIDDSTVRIFGDVAIHSGIYTFRFEDDTAAQARFTYVYRRDTNGWLIVEHHSSLMPE